VTELEPAADVQMWRPTAQSFLNLTIFGASLFASAAVVLALTHSATLVAATAGMALAASAPLTGIFTRKRVSAALAVAETPQLGNWPGTIADRRQLKRHGWVRCGRSMAMALVVGALGGFYPVAGVAFVGAGLAGALASGVVTRMVRGFETQHDVTVMSASDSRHVRRRLRFGVAAGRL
jgi:hypothetical protein